MELVTCETCGLLHSGMEMPAGRGKITHAHLHFGRGLPVEPEGLFLLVESPNCTCGLFSNHTRKLCQMHSLEGGNRDRLAK